MTPRERAEALAERCAWCGVSLCDHCQRDVERAIESALAEQAAGEAERTAQAEMARDVAWVRAIEACGGNSARYVQYVFNVPGYYDAARVQYAANHGDDIAAAIRAARGAR